MADFAPANTSTIKMDVKLNENGTIAQNGETVGGKKTFSITGVKQSATLAQAKTVYDAFIGTLAGGTFDTLTAEKWTVQKVVE